jgi:RNA polymerase-binding transcription factor DksA
VIDTAAIRRELSDRLASLDEELGDLTAVPRDPASAVSFGKRIGDGTTEAVERLTRVGTAEQLAAMRADVRRALTKLDDGTYGLCDRCGLVIPDERLEARPWSVLCVRCAASRSTGR